MNGRETLLLTDFSAGTISNADAKDIPDNAASYSLNIDGDASNGRLVGIPDKAEYKSSARGYNACRGSYIARANGTYDFVYDDGTNIKAINDWYSAFGADGGVSVAYRGYSFVNRNQEVHIGCGTSNPAQWVGKIDYGVMNEAVPTNLYLSNATLPVPAQSTGSFYISNAGFHLGATSEFDQNLKYNYALSIEYDYTQETPLLIDSSNTTTGAGNVDYIEVTVRCHGGASSPTSINKRITAVKIYRMDFPSSLKFSGQPGLTGKPYEGTLYRFIKRLPTNGLTQTGFSWIVDGNDYVASFNGSDTFIKDDNSIVGGTYEQESGIAENLTSTDLKYTVSCECNNYLFAGGCSKTEVPGAANMVFRSKAYRYDTFDWSKVGEFVNLQSKPLAIANFMGRVWVFDSHNIYRINPDSMVVEDATTGIGCYSQRSIKVTDYGMFWCDANGAYWHDGNTITKISDPITSATGAWHSFSNGGYSTGSQDGAPIVVFYAKKNTIVFAVPDTTFDKMRCWGFHVIKKRWDEWLIDDNTTITTSAGMWEGKANDVYYCDGNSKLFDAFSGGTKGWIWVTKVFDYGNPRQRKRLCGISYTGTVTMTYRKDAEGSYTNNATTPMVNMNAYKTQFYISASATNYLDYMSVLYRRLHLNA
jgi:hypothetical protein